MKNKGMKKRLSILLVGMSMVALLASGCGANKSEASKQDNESINLSISFEGDREKEVSSFTCVVSVDGTVIVEKDFDADSIQKNDCSVDIDKALVEGAEGIDVNYVVDGKYSFGSKYCLDNCLDVTITYDEENDCYESALCG